MFITIREFLLELFPGQYAWSISTAIILLGVLLVAVAFYYILKYILQGLESLVFRTPTEWDDDLINARFLRSVAQLAPAICVRWLLLGFFGESADSIRWLSILTSIYILATAVRIVTIFIDNLYDAFVRRPKLRVYAVKGIFQMLKLIMIGLGVIVCISILIGRSPVTILTALGASAAVLSLVFKDTILGLVASIQLSANKMLQRGDWITMEKNGVDGEVIDVTLTTVKVRNWDKSVSTIPPYSLITDSFRNFQPMKEADARRVRRAVYIDVNTVRYCTAEELADLRSRGWLEGIEIEDASRMVNLQLFRRYLEVYLANHPDVRKDCIYMVRQLEPTPSGLPVELYFFSAITEWKPFEHIQAEVFDHVYAMVQLFGLRIFQTPAGTDLSRAR